MIIIKKFNGELEYVKIKDYNDYSLYQVYKVINEKRIECYKECFTKLQLKGLMKNEMLYMS